MAKSTPFPQAKETEYMTFDVNSQGTRIASNDDPLMQVRAFKYIFD